MGAGATDPERCPLFWMRTSSARPFFRLRYACTCSADVGASSKKTRVNPSSTGPGLDNGP
jgi:hypothetical protein